MAFNVSYVIQAIDQFSAVAAKVQQGMQSINKSAEEMTNRMAANAEKVTSLGKSLSLGVTAPLTAIAGLSLHAAAEQEKLNVQIENVVGNVEKAKALGEQLEKIKMNSPIDVAQVDDAALRLLVMGTSVDKVSGIIGNFAKISAGSGESLANLTEMFAVAKSGPEGMSRAINMMNRKIPVLAELQKMIKEKTGKMIDFKDIRQLAAEGRISSGALQEAFARMTREGGKFFGSIDKQSHTLSGSMQLLRNNFHRFQESLGFAIMGSVDLSGAVLSINEAMKDAVHWVEEFAKNNPELTKMIVIFGAIAAAVGPMLVGLGLAMNGLAGIGKAVMFLSTPMGLMVAGIAAAVFALGYLYSKFEFIRDIVNTVVSVVYNLITAFPLLTAALTAAAFILLSTGRGALILQAGMAALRIATMAYAAIVASLPMVLGAARVALLVLNLAFTANPMGVMIVAIGALVTGLGFLIGKFGSLDGILQFIKDKAVAVADAFQRIFSFNFSAPIDALKGMLSSGVNKVSGLFGAGSTTPEPLINNNVGVGVSTIKSESQSSVDINIKGNPGVIESIKSKTDGKTNLAVTQNMALGGY